MKLQLYYDEPTFTITADGRLELVHDYLYSGGDFEATRADADDLFRDLQISLGVPRWKAYVEWAALRLFGGSHWQGAKKKENRNEENHGGGPRGPRNLRGMPRG